MSNIFLKNGSHNLKGGESDLITNDDKYKLIELFFKQKNIMYIQAFSSFDKFLDDDLKNFLLGDNSRFYEKQTKDKIITYKFVFSNIAIRPPMDDNDELITPYDARTKRLTYSVKLVATVTQVQEIFDINTEEKITKVIGTPEHEWPISAIPIMVNSRYCSNTTHPEKNIYECRFDPGTYFIISRSENSSEKTLINTERMIENKPLVFTKKDANVVLYSVVINSKSYVQDIKQTITIRMNKIGSMDIYVHLFNKEIPVFILVRALGIESDYDIINHITLDKTDTDMINLITISLDHCKNELDNKILTQEQAITYLLTKVKTSKRIRYSETDKDIKNHERKLYIRHVLESLFMPHVDNTPTHKGLFICYMIRRLLQCVLKRVDIDDRDSLVNKRIDLPGVLMFELYKQSYKKMLNECTKFFVKRNSDDENPLNIINQIKPNTIEQALRTGLLTGSWDKKKGVAQMLQRLTYKQTVSLLRRVNSPATDASTNKLTSPRHLHPTQIGFLCYIETPEGHQVGLVKNLAVASSISIMLPSQISILKGMIKPFVTDILDIPLHRLKSYTKVFINGEPVGETLEPRKIFAHFKKLKLNGTISPQTSIVHDIKNEIECKELYIYCDGGRCFRPIFRVEDFKLCYNKEMVASIAIDPTHESNKTFITTWTEFMKRYPTAVEYIDQHEQNNAMIAMYPEDIITMKNRKEQSIKTVADLGDIDNMSVINRYDDTLYMSYTHCEIHPSLHLGIVANGIPFCNSNQGPRNVYQFSQAKQAMSIYMTSYRHRLDISYILYHPYRPIVYCRMNRFTNNDQLPSGENCVVAIACYGGYNQEDSIIVNQTSIDRGMFRSTNLSKIISDIQKNQSTSQDDIFVKPEPDTVIGMKHASYEKLNEHGYVPEETEVVKGDIILGKISPIQPIGGETNTKRFKDSSEAYKYIIPGVIDKVWTKIYTSEGYEIRMVRVRSERKPHIGDKLCCYTDDHQVLTSRGWTNIKDVTKNHKVATIKNNSLKYENPTAIQSFNYSGSIYVVDTNNISIRVTPNHRMYVNLNNNNNNNNYSIKEARDIYGIPAFYKKTADSYINITTNKSIDRHNNVFIVDSNKNYSIPLLSWIRFISLWISDKDSKVINNTTITMSNEKIVIDAIKSIKLSYKENKRSIFIDCDSKIAEILELSHLEWISGLEKDECITIIKGMIGNIKHDVATINNLNRLKKDALEMIAVQAGYCVTSMIKDCDKEQFVALIHFDTTEFKINKNIKSDKPINMVTYNFDGVRKSLPEYQSQQDKYEDYQGKVYCCTVPSGIIYVRRARHDKDNHRMVSSACWCGNSLNGQKGVTGLTLCQSDMPFTKDGISPDLIISPNAIPSRMTMGQLIECLLGKVSAIRGHESDGSPFQDLDLEKVKDILESHGYNRNGYEYLYNGMTGRKMKSQIFIGPTYYQRLKHMVSDKIHARARGPKTALTKQAPEGRSRDGGHRFGEMERDSMIAHGCAKFLKERTMETADAHSVYICIKCGLIAQRKIAVTNEAYPTSKDIYHCKACKNTTDISKIRIPYAFKLLVQEMMSMSIAPRIRIKQSKYI